MPVKLSVGVSRKCSLPGFASVGAHCGLEIDLADDVLIREGQESYEQIASRLLVRCESLVQQRILSACKQHAELSDEPFTGVVTGGVTGGATGMIHARLMEGKPSRSPNRNATQPQLRAITAIAARQNIDPNAEAQRVFSVSGIDQLSVSQASRLIDLLQASGTQQAAS